jgi:hypothetical protein
MHTLYHLYASQIATIIWTVENQSLLEISRRSVVVGLALRAGKSNGTSMGLSESERSVFQGVMTMLYELLDDNS